MILLIVFIGLASGIMFSFSLVAGIANLLIPADMVRAVQKVIRQNAMQSRTSTFVGILLYITGAPGAFFQSLEPGDRQRKIGSLNCNLARAIRVGILWHMLLYTRDMIGFHV